MIKSINLCKKAKMRKIAISFLTLDFFKRRRKKGKERIWQKQRHNITDW